MFFSDLDLMLSLHTVSAPILSGKGAKQLDFQLSFWKEIVPKEDPEVSSIRPWILVHTATHQPPLPDEMRRAANSRNHNIPAEDKGSFCGWDKPTSFIRLDLAPEYLRRVTTELGLPGINPAQGYPVLHPQEPKMLQVSRWLLEELLKGSRSGSLSVDSLVNLLAVQILLRSSLAVNGQTTASIPQEVARAIEYMQAHISKDISLAELSHIIHLSPSQLGRLFKRYTDLSPHQYLILLRADHARKLLHGGMRPVAEVASQSGFADQSHMNRHFKRIYGVTAKKILNGG